MRRSAIDWPLLLVAFSLLLMVTLLLVSLRDQASVFLQGMQFFITHTLGSVFLWFTFGGLVFLIWLACSRYGKISMGEGPPEFSTLSWGAMLFCTGVTSSVIYWGNIEWAVHYFKPPFGITPASPAAAEWAITYAFFHWGASAWAMYCLPVLPIAYGYYVRKRPIMKISQACYGVLGERCHGSLGRGIDLLFMITVLANAGTTLALNTPLLSATINRLTGYEGGIELQIGLILGCATLASISVTLGLKYGIRYLSNANIAMTLILLIWVFLFSSTTFMVNITGDSLGLMVNEFVRMSTWTDSIRGSNFPQNWTIFYWAWWIVAAPVMGLFTARISRGRTIRQIIIGMLAYGCAAAWLCFAILGGFQMELQLSGHVDLAATLVDAGQVQYSALPTALLNGFSHLPWHEGATLLLLLICIIFLATSFDSNAYTLSMAATHRLPLGQDPHTGQRIFWALALSLLPMVFLWLGGLHVLQSAVLMAAVPFLAIMLIMVVSFMKEIRQDYPSTDG